MRDHKEDIEKLKLSEHEKDVVRRINVWIAFERGTTFIWFVLAYLVFLGLALIFSGLIVLLSLRVKRLEHKIKGLSLLKGEESEEGA